jgi:hypothetical protein
MYRDAAVLGVGFWEQRRRPIIVVVIVRFAD